MRSRLIHIQEPWALPNGRDYELHKAANKGSIKDTEQLLSRKGYVACIDRADPQGWTALMHGTWKGSSSVVGTLLSNGASVAFADDEGCTALILSVQRHHLTITKMLLEAGADTEAKTTSDSSNGSTSLHLAVKSRQPEAIRALIEAGANPNSRSSDGTTPLLLAAYQGCVACIRELLRGKADPTLGITTPSVGSFIPLDAAAQNGHLDAVRELLQQVGLEGCGGPTRGESALDFAGRQERLEIMATLTDAGVADRNGLALVGATGCGREASVKFLLQQQEGATGRYVNRRNRDGATPLLSCFPLSSAEACYPRMVRLLVDAGAHTTSSIVIDHEFSAIPLEFVAHYLQAGFEGIPFTKEQSNRLKTARRVLLQAEGVHAVSWLWLKAPFPTDHAAVKSMQRAEPVSSALTMTLPILRRRAARRKILLLAPLFRWV